MSDYIILLYSDTSVPVNLGVLSVVYYYVNCNIRNSDIRFTALDAAGSATNFSYIRMSRLA